MTRSGRGAPRNSSGRISLEPVDWIRAATQLLVSKSIDAVGIDALCKELNVTKGSFYWHFSDRSDLLKQILLAWRDEATEHVVDRFQRSSATHTDLVNQLLNLPLHGEAARNAASTELAIRAWARRDELARRVVDEVDAQRLSYIAQCFSGLGFDIREARARAFVLYSHQLAESLLANQGTSGERDDRTRYVEQLLLQPPLPFANQI